MVETSSNRTTNGGNIANAGYLSSIPGRVPGAANAVRVLPAIGGNFYGPRDRFINGDSGKNVSFSLDDGGVYKGPSTNGILKNGYAITPSIGDNRDPNGRIFSQNNGGSEANTFANSNGLNPNPERDVHRESEQLCRTSMSNGDLIRNNGVHWLSDTQNDNRVSNEDKFSREDVCDSFVDRGLTAIVPPGRSFSSNHVNTIHSTQLINSDRKNPEDANLGNGTNYINRWASQQINIPNTIPEHGQEGCVPPIIPRNSSNTSSMSSSHPSSSSGHVAFKQCVTYTKQAGEPLNQPTVGRGVLNQSSTEIIPAGILRNALRDSNSSSGPTEGGVVLGRAAEDKEKVVRIDPKVVDLKERTKTGIGSSFMGKNKQARPFLSSLNHFLGHGSSSCKNGPLSQANTNTNDNTQQSHTKDTKDNSSAAGEELRKAAALGDLGKIQTLLGKPGSAAGAQLVNSLDEGGSSALLRSACEGRVAALRLLLRHGANVDHQDRLHGNTGLHEACWKGYSETCVALVKARAHLHLKNKGGFAALHLACQNGHNQSCRVLLLAGCDPNIKNNYGDTPLHTAARYGHAGVTRILLSAKADVHAANKNGDSCLHIAAAMGRRKLTRILLEAGAKQNGFNKQEETPQDIARRKNFQQILEILQNPPAVVSPEERLKREREQTKKEGTNNIRRKEDKGDKREKNNDSGTSSKDSSTRQKDKKKLKSENRERRSGGCRSGVHWSPYGCHSHTAALDLPNIDSSALPKGALKAGEQYYVDLAGNVKKGPVAVGNSCYCAPFFKKVEHKLESDKVALMDHIDAHHEKLDKRIHSLERKTHTHIHNLKQTVQNKLSEERRECLQRTTESAADREARLAAHAQGLQQWVEKRLEAHDPALPPTLRRALSRIGSGRHRDPVTGLYSLSRSRSEEALTDAMSDLNEATCRGLRVMDHPTSMYNLHQQVHDEDAEGFKDSNKHASTTASDSTGRPAFPDAELEESGKGSSRHMGPDHVEVMEDSSDSEGEQEPLSQDTSSYRRSSRENGAELEQDVGKLSLNHPYYANTGAIPKGSATSLPESIFAGDSSNREIVKVDVHAPNELVPQSKWPSYHRYDPRNNRRYLYDVQEVEPSYGDVAPTMDQEHVRDSGCSEGSSQTDIGDVMEFNGPEQPSYSVKQDHRNLRKIPEGNNHESHEPRPDNNSSSATTNEQMSGTISYHNKVPATKSSETEKTKYDDKFLTEYGKHCYPVAPAHNSQEAAVYLDMDRYRIQQAVRRLYDGYLTEGRLEHRRGKAALESSLEHDSHNDSGYSTRMCTASQGPSPALSGTSVAQDGSGSESRSGHSTSSPNTTVIAYPHKPSSGVHTTDMVPPSLSVPHLATSQPTSAPGNNNYSSNHVSDAPLRQAPTSNHTQYAGQIHHNKYHHSASLHDVAAAQHYPVDYHQSNPALNHYCNSTMDQHNYGRYAAGVLPHGQHDVATTYLTRVPYNHSSTHFNPSNAALKTHFNPPIAAYATHFNQPPAAHSAHSISQSTNNNAHSILDVITVGESSLV